MKLLRGLLLKPTLNLLHWILTRKEPNSLIIGGPLGWSWQPTLDTAHHGSLAGPAKAHRHSDLDNIGIDDHHARDHAARHGSGGADAVTLDASQIGTGRLGLAKMPDGASGYFLQGAGAGNDPSYVAHKDLTTGVHGVGSNYMAQAPAAGHLVRTFTKGWTTRTRLKGAGANADPVEYDDFVSITFIIDGGGSVITTGQKGHLQIPFACTINSWTILADQPGSIVIDVWKDTYDNFPPTAADTITGTEKPTLSSAQKNRDLTLTTWTTAIGAGDILAFNVDSVSTITRVTLSIEAIKS